MQSSGTVSMIHSQNPKNNNNNNQTQQQSSTSISHHRPDQLKTRWRSLASSVVVAIRSASRNNISIVNNVETMVQTTFQMRSELRKDISSMENHLKGQSQELEALEHLMQTCPCAGRRKKRKISDEEEANLTNENKNNNLQHPSDPIVDIEVVDLS